MPSQKPGSKSSEAAGFGNILSFFKPAAQQRPQTPSQPLRGSVTASTPLSSPPPSSSPTRTTTPPPAAQEIPASDDNQSDGDTSDDSLEDLSTLLRHRQSPAALPLPQASRHSPYATPRAKRTEVHFHSSPLAFTAKHKFDFKALAKDARLDDATTASSMRAKAAADEAERNSKSPKDDSSGDAIREIVKERSGKDAQKVLRAVQRSESGHSQQRYCFFDPDYKCPPSKTAPRRAATGPWRLLTQGSMELREQHLASGILQTTIRKIKKLPDSLLEWILDELCIQKSMLIRSEYCTIVADCSEQVARLMTPERLQELFTRLGADERLAEQGSGLTLFNLEHEPYRDRDWACLRSFLWLLGAIAPHLSAPTVNFATRALLRMSMDRFLICNVDVLVEYENAIQCLAGAVPNSSWDLFCLELSVSLSTAVEDQNVRANALLCLPLSSERIHDLRRRLAAVFLFGNTALASHNSADVLTIMDFIGLLNNDEYTIHQDTDFAELKSRIILLDIAISDGCAVDSDDREDERQFNEDVDKLASKLREIWRKINDSGMKLARTEAKSVVEWVQQRLSHAVRTRTKVRKSVFDIGGQGEDPFALRQQQDYMKRFLRPKSVDGDGGHAATDGA